MPLITQTKNAGITFSKSAVIRSVLVTVADTALRSSLRAYLEELRWSVREATGAAEALTELERELPEAVIIGDWLPDLHTAEFTQIIISHHAHLDLLTPDGQTLNKGVRSERRHELVSALREAQGTVKTTPRSSQSFTTHRAPQEARPTALQQASPGEMVGRSPVMIDLYEQIRLVAPFDTTVLIEGETGTGKELVANALHQQGERRDRAFVVLNCAAIPETLLEAELFGHTRGAFTGAVQSRTGRIEAADGGTLFLDEIGEMPIALQAKMLRFLENGELQKVGDNTLSRVDVRIIAATHRDLEQRCSEGTFRLDLYHRLAVFPVEVPPLRSRTEDIILLAERALDRLGVRNGRKHLTPDALEELLGHHWPGNVRELMHVMERAVILSNSRTDIVRTDIRIRRRPRA